VDKINNYKIPTKFPIDSIKFYLYTDNMKKKDIKPVSKTDVEEIVEQVVDQVVTRRFEEQKYWIEDKLMDLKSEFFNKIDPFLKEIKLTINHCLI